MIRIRPHRAAAGFTLVEALVCAVLMSLGFLALVAAFGHDSVVAQRGEDVTLATFFADEVRNMTLQMPFEDILDLNGASYSPAVLSTGGPGDLADWSQRLTVSPVALTDLNATVPAAGAMAARITVEVRRLGEPVLAETYYVFKMTGVPFTDGG